MPYRALAALFVTLLAACGGGSPETPNVPDITDAPDVPNDPPAGANPPDNGGAGLTGLDAELVALIDDHGLTGDPTFNRTLPSITDPLADLGKSLFFSKSLGGDLDSACVSCHHPMLGGADALTLPVGVGAVDPDLLGPGRAHVDGVPNVPRNSPTVFNLGLWDTSLFWDSRVESFGAEPGANGSVSDIRTPDVAFGAADPDAGPNLAAAQARFPVTSAEEMRGHAFEATGDNDTVRAHLAARLGSYGVGAGELTRNEWRLRFRAAFGEGDPQTLITYDNIALALAEYQRSMVFIDNPWKAYVEGERDALSDAQKRGAIAFMTPADGGGGGCIDCHSGDTFSDGGHRLVAFPQFGPGKGDGNGDDFGRARETGLASDRYRFRTPSLLNVAVTAPYGHGGVYETLAEVLRHYDDTGDTVNDFFDNGGACQLEQFEDDPACATRYPNALANSRAALDALRDARDAGDALFQPTNLNGGERDDIEAFLQALTDPCVRSRACMAPWIADTESLGPDAQQLNARDASGDLL
ncbi:MAG: cytochrome c peroxidase [Pseudomonadota bacterium]